MNHKRLLSITTLTTIYINLLVIPSSLVFLAGDKMWLITESFLNQQ